MVGAYLDEDVGAYRGMEAEGQHIARGKIAVYDAVLREHLHSLAHLHVCACLYIHTQTHTHTQIFIEAENWRNWKDTKETKQDSRTRQTDLRKVVNTYLYVWLHNKHKVPL